MEHWHGLFVYAIALAAVLSPMGILWIVFRQKAHHRELELRESLRLRESEHLRRLKELELELEKARAQGRDAPN